MADELQIQFTTGETLYAIRSRASDGDWYDVAGGAYEAALTSAWADYAVSLTEVGASGWYLGDDPDGAGAEGGYSVFLQAGGSPAASDAQIGAGSLGEAAAIATSVWAAGTRTLSSFGTLVADIWAGITTTALAKFVTQDTGETTPVAGSVAKLAQGDADADAIADAVVAGVTSAAQSDSITTDGTTITRRRGDTWTIPITGLGSITDRSELWITIKNSKDDDDSESIIMVTEGSDLIYLNGAAAATSTDASIAIDDDSAGDITLTVKPAATSTIETRAGMYYDVQKITSAGAVDTLTEGRFKVVSDVTQATSA